MAASIRRRAAWYGVLAVTMLGAIGAMVAQRQADPPDPAKARAAGDLSIAVALARDVRDGLKNPASFDLVAAAIQPDGSVCMTYRATNSFNAITTAQAVRPKRGKQYWLSEGGDTADFRRQWAAACTPLAADQARMVKRFM